LSWAALGGCLRHFAGDFWLFGAQNTWHVPKEQPETPIKTNSLLFFGEEL
jgi:hypothetical protein